MPPAARLRRPPRLRSSPPASRPPQREPRAGMPRATATATRIAPSAVISPPGVSATSPRSVPARTIAAPAASRFHQPEIAAGRSAWVADSIVPTRIATTPMTVPGVPASRTRTSAAPAPATSSGTPGGASASEVELNLGRAVFAVDQQGQRAVLGRGLGDLEDQQRTLDRPDRGHGVRCRDLALRRDLLPERERVGALALDRLELVLVGVDDGERAGQGLRLLGVVVLDLGEDAEVDGVLPGCGLALQVCLVLGVVGVEEAREEDVVFERAELHRLALDDAGGLFAAAAGQRDRRGDEPCRQHQACRSAPSGHQRRESIDVIERPDPGAAAARRSPPATPTAPRRGASDSSRSRRRRSAIAQSRSYQCAATPTVSRS